MTPSMYNTVPLGWTLSARTLRASRWKETWPWFIHGDRFEQTEGWFGSLHRASKFLRPSNFDVMPMIIRMTMRWIWWGRMATTTRCGMILIIRIDGVSRRIIPAIIIIVKMVRWRRRMGGVLENIPRRDGCICGGG